MLLRGLDQEDVGRFIELVSGITPPIGMLEAVHGQTEGNPLFVTEVVRLLVQEEEFTQEKAGQRDSWSVRIPEGVREVIGRRLDRLSERCNETLTIASVVGREFTLDQLSPLIEDISGDRLLDVLDEALSARVIEELPQSVGRYQFTHALIQETLAEELSTTRRVRLHGRIAQVLEELYGADVEAHAAELAHHFAEAQSVAGTEKLVRYSALAGERALSTYGYDEAQAHFERALAAQEGQGTDAGAAPLLFELGRAQGALFQRREALASLNSAFDHYAGAGDIQGAVSVAEYPINPGMGRVRVTQLISRALALVPPDSHQAGNLLSRYGLALGNEMGDYSGAEEAFNKALTIARRDKDVALELRVLANSATVDFLHLRWQDCVEKGLRAVELSGSGKGGDPQVEVTARFWAGLALAYMGDLDGAQQQQTAALFQAERLRHRGLLSSVLVRKEVIAHLTGDWRSARTFIDQGLAAVAQETRLLSVRVLLEYEVGEFDQGEVYLERFLEVTRRTAPGPTFEYGLLSIVLPVVARITGAANREDIAEAAATAILASPSAIPLFTMYARGSLALLAMRRADVVAATEHYNALRAMRGMVFPGNAIVTDGMLGLLAQTMGNMAQSAAHYEDALAFCREAGYRPGLAWICCDYADMLRERDGEGDRAKAMTLLDESLAISSELGMRPLMERVLYRREILGA